MPYTGPRRKAKPPRPPLPSKPVHKTKKAGPEAPPPAVYDSTPDDGVPKTGKTSLRASKAKILTQTERVLAVIEEAQLLGATREEIAAQTKMNSHAADKCIQILIDGGLIRYNSKTVRVSSTTGREHTALVAVPQWTRKDPRFIDLWGRFARYLEEAERIREEKERNHRRMLNVLTKIAAKARISS